MAQTAVGKVALLYTASTAGLKTGLSQAERLVGGSARRMESSFSAVESRLTGMFTAGAIIGGVKYAIDQFTEAERATARFNAVLDSTGSRATISARGVADLAGELERVTRFDAEATLLAASKLATFTNVQGSTFTESIRLAQDLATVMETDLQSAVVQLGKALNDPIRGVTALSKSGVSFDATQRSMIRSLVESNRLFEAQSIILAELNKEVGGAAQKDLQGYEKSLRQLTVAWGDLAEAFGKTAAEKLTPALDFTARELRAENDPFAPLNKAREFTIATPAARARLASQSADEIARDITRLTTLQKEYRQELMATEKHNDSWEKTLFGVSYATEQYERSLLQAVNAIDTFVKVRDDELKSRPIVAPPVTAMEAAERGFFGAFMDHVSGRESRRQVAAGRAEAIFDNLLAGNYAPEALGRQAMVLVEGVKNAAEMLGDETGATDLVRSLLRGGKRDGRAASLIAAQGTFNARHAESLGATSIAAEVQKATIATAKNTDKIERNTRDGGFFFN